MPNLSPHFTLTELTVTTRPDRGDLDGDGDRAEPMPNVPTPGDIGRLTALCADALEPARALLAVPLKVTSGYRSPALNAAIGGPPTSQHMKGEAADVVPLGVDAADAMRAIVGSDIPYDQVILYPNARTPFLHISHRADGRNRRQALYSDASGGSGGPYHPWPKP